MAAKGTDVDAYLGALPEEERVALEAVRSVIHAVAPGVVETISYQIPTFKLHARLVFSIAAFKRHCSLYPMSRTMFDALEPQISRYATMSGKATLRFDAGKPLPASLVRRIVKARLSEMHAGARTKR